MLSQCKRNCDPKSCRPRGRSDRYIRREASVRKAGAEEREEIRRHLGLKTGGASNFTWRPEQKDSFGRIDAHPDEEICSGARWINHETCHAARGWKLRNKSDQEIVKTINRLEQGNIDALHKYSDAKSVSNVRSSTMRHVKERDAGRFGSQANEGILAKCG